MCPAKFVTMGTTPARPTSCSEKATPWPEKNKRHDVFEQRKRHCSPTILQPKTSTHRPLRLPRFGSATSRPEDSYVTSGNSLNLNKSINGNLLLKPPTSGSALVIICIYEASCCKKSYALKTYEEIARCAHITHLHPRTLL